MLFQRFIVKVIGGKENSIVQEIKERISTYGFNEYIKSIVIINKKIVKEQLFKHDDEKLPANKKNTANIV
jgi:transcription antitermination factor NusG